MGVRQMEALHIEPEPELEPEPEPEPASTAAAQQGQGICAVVLYAYEVNTPFRFLSILKHSSYN